MGTFPRHIIRTDRCLEPRIHRIIDQYQAPDNPRYASKLPGDSHALRGIPAIGRGVTGAIPGTIP